VSWKSSEVLKKPRGRELSPSGPISRSGATGATHLHEEYWGWERGDDGADGQHLLLDFAARRKRKHRSRRHGEELTLANPELQRPPGGKGKGTLPERKEEDRLSGSVYTSSAPASSRERWE